MTFILHKVPFISQMNNVLMLEGSLTRDEMDRWEYNLCGLLCSFMVIKGLKEASLTLQNILHEAINIHAYDYKVGWIHEKLIELLSIYEIEAFRRSKSDLQIIEQLIKSNHLLIASVSPTYIQSKRPFFFNKKSGHLILIIGIESENNHIIKIHIHDPGSKESAGGENIALDPHLFLKNFSGNVIAIKRTNNDE